MKSKKILTILLSLAIMFTFMPAMAFATTTTHGQYNDTETGDTIKYDAVWGDNFDYVEINGVRFNTIRTLAGATYSDGAITSLDGWTGAVRATIDFTDRDTTYATNYANPNGSLAYVDYYDLDFATVGLNDEEFGSEYPQGSFETKFAHTETDGTWAWDSDEADVFFAIPDYVEGYSGLTKTQKATKKLDPTGFNWTASLSSLASYVSGSTSNQTIEVKTTLSIGSTATPALKKGNIKDKTITISGVSKTPATAKYYIDSTSNAVMSTASVNVAGTREWRYGVDGYLMGMYDGNTHTVVADEVPGWTATYAVYDSAKGDFVDTTSPVTIKDVQVKADGSDDPMQVRVTYKQSGRTDQVKYFCVNLVPALATVSFNKDLSETDASVITGWDQESDGEGGFIWTPRYSTKGNITYSVAGAEYDAMSYVKVAPDSKPLTGASASKIGDLRKAQIAAENAANKAGVEANEADLNAYYKEVFEVKETPSKADPNVIALAIQQKSLTSAEKKAIDAKYAQLLKNVRVFADDDDFQTATLKINQSAPNVAEDDITFKGVTKKTYKAKKSTKKLAKAKSFNVKAVADSGNAIKFTYTSTNSKVTCTSAGKIKVKKGLKKGTYKITVKAKTAAGNGYKAAKASKTYTIKVK